MKHKVVFDNVFNKWDNALPVGNGCFGAMLYYEDGFLNMPMNHYEVYYNINKNVLPEDILKNSPEVDDPGKEHREYVELAKKYQRTPDVPFHDYTARYKEDFCDRPFGIFKFSGSYPDTGTLKFTFSDELKECKSKLKLEVEDAEVSLNLKNNNDEIDIKTIVAREDCIINKVTQTKKLLKSVSIKMEPYRDIDMPEITYGKINDTTFSYTVKRVLEGGEEPFVFSGIIKLIGASGSLLNIENGAEIELIEQNKEFYILTGIFTMWNYKDTLNDGICKIEEFAKNIFLLYSKHHNYWEDFFNKSNIDIPDKFLEHVYYINQYALDACSGEGGVMKHHACGLNGLWDVKHPTLWGSMWYWDVNIQASFAGVFSSNRINLAKVFSDGLLSYVELAEKYAKDVHNLSGCAFDYPYQNYYCVWPWCAQYLWFLYEYTLDKEYLKNEAYPLFLKLCEFAVSLFEYDKKTDKYFVYPDISPEQGPLAHNTTITVACTKYLLKFTLKAAEILEDKSELLEKCKELYEKMPEYAMTDAGIYGERIKDSYDAPDNLFVRHPSMLMPLFPIGEFDTYNDKKMHNIFSNTVDFLEDNSEIGIFGGSWIAASAARLGRGQTALRLLYERGIDHMLRSNGLTAEETDHFINYCLLPRQPLYYPCMMEFTGEMLVAVNEMLIQSHDGIIRIFPAIPDGSRELERLLRNGYPMHKFVDSYIDYPKWDNVRIDKLLAKGAFEISASLKDSKLEWITVNSKKGGKVQLTSPFISDKLKVFCDDELVESSYDNGIISFDTKEGKAYIIAESSFVNMEKEETENEDVLVHESYTKRHIFIGENQEALYHKALDGSIRDWYLGNVRMSNHVVYKFDFTNEENKDYVSTLARQSFCAEKRNITSISFECIGDSNIEFCPKQGYGFSSADGIKIVERKIDDAIRKDFAQGTDDVEFIIEAPRGQYELLIISGDESSDSVTMIDAVNGISAGGDVVAKGVYQCELIPIIQKKDVPLRIKISTKEGYMWKINAIIMNVIKGY